jgi:hypothetical protein
MPRLSSAGNSVPATMVNYSKVKRMNGDNHYHSEIRRLLEDDLSVHQVIAIPSQSPKWTLPRLMPTFPEQTQATMLDRDIKGVRRSAAALGRCVEARCGCRGAGRSEPQGLLPG